MRTLAGDPEFLGDMSDRTPIQTDPPHQQAAAVKGETGVTTPTNGFQLIPAGDDDGAACTVATRPGGHAADTRMSPSPARLRSMLPLAAPTQLRGVGSVETKRAGIGTRARWALVRQYQAAREALR
jgi:hypothetical protein